MTDATMILLDPIIEIGIAAMEDLITQRLADGTGVGIMPIGRHPLWSVAYHLGGLPEKALGRLHIPLLAQHRVH
jgi:hypothetical protein